MEGMMTKILENRLRRVANRRGLRLVKSRRRDPQAVDFGCYCLVGWSDNFIVFGSGPCGYDASLEEIETYLENR